MTAFRRWIAAVVTGGAIALAASGSIAQVSVVVLVNGDPITNLDIEHRTRFIQLATQKTPSRQEVLDELIDEKLKLQLVRRFDFSRVNLDNEVDEAIKRMARSRHLNVSQFSQELASRGVPLSTLKSRTKAQLVWTQVIRGKYQASLRLNDSEILKELESRKTDASVGYDYTLRPLVFIVPRGSPPAVVESRRREAEGLRNRFTTCEEGIPFARALGAVVRDPIVRSSADLPPQLRELLAKTEVGHLTPPETLAEGVGVYAVCAKKQSSKDNTPGSREVREEYYTKQFEAKSKEFLAELRSQAYLQYK